MIQVVLIAMVIVLAARDGLPGLPLTRVDDLPSALLVGVAPMAALAIVVQFIHVLCGRGLDRTGRLRFVAIADTVLTVSRALAPLLLAIAVLGYGWLDWVRATVGGNLILVDEALTLTPGLLALTAGWWSHYPIDRRLREAALMGWLDTGHPVTSIPTRRQYLVEQVRHHMLLVLVPVTALTAWAELLHHGRPTILRTIPWTLSDEAQSMFLGGLQLIGVLVLLILMPVGLRWIWRTSPLGPGLLRDRLTALCQRQRVRVRGVYVWRTHSGMINGALVGLIPWTRSILLTETLLERLPADEVEAVMAHEVAHARRHHLPWLLGVLMASLGLSWWAVAFPLAWAARSLGFPFDRSTVPWLEASTMLGSLLLTLLVFSWVSRKFERQADAFGAQHLSGLQRGKVAPPGATIQPEAAWSMIRALGAVARLNRVPPRKFSWRHGSIRQRQRYLQAAIGRPVFPLPIDRQVRWIKIVTLAALAAVAGLTLFGAA